MMSEEGQHDASSKNSIKDDGTENIREMVPATAAMFQQQ